MPETALVSRYGRWLIALLSVSVVVAMLFVAACGGDDDDDDGSEGGEPTSTETAENGGEEEEEGGEEGEDPLSALEALSGDYQDVVANVAYEFTTTTSDGTTTTSSMTIYSRPPNSRTDFVDSATGETTVFISTEDKAYVCSEDQCISYPTAGALNPIPFVGQYAYPGAITQLVAGYRGVDIEKSNQEIAGRDTTCFAAEQSGVTVSWCFGDNGLLLRSSTKSSEGEFAMEATDVDVEVSDGDFEPPYPVTDLSGLGR